MLRAALAVLIALSAAGAAAADRGASPAALELSRTILPPENWAMIVRRSSEQAASAIARSGQGKFHLAPTFGERLHDEYLKLMPYDEAVALQAERLAAQYRDDELRQLVRFYRSPVGQKSLRVMPEVMRGAIADVQVSVQQRLPAVLERLKPLFVPDQGATQ